MGWSCRCGEVHEDVVAKCWSCGASSAALLASATSRTVFGSAGSAATTASQAGESTLAGERTLAPFRDGTITLTTHRVRLEYASFGRSILKSIMLEHVTACAVAQVSYPALLLLAAVFVLVSFAFGLADSSGWVVSLVISLVLVAVYFSSRREVISIGSASTEIRMDVAGHSQGAARGFIEALEAAKDARYRSVGVHV
jgi:hypothetical protein